MSAGHGRAALLVALAVDDLGSGLFLPLSVVYIHTVVGVRLSLAGVLVTAGTLVGLLAPPVAGRLVDRVGSRAVVVASQVLQATGMGAYLLAQGPGSVVVAAALVAAGAQTFYSALFALIADVAPAGAKDRSFAVVDMVRSGAFGLGALTSALLVSLAPPGALRVAVAVDGVSFVLAAALLLVLVHPSPHRPATATFAPRLVAAPAPGAGGDPHGVRGPSVRRDRPYLAFIAVTGLLALATDFFLIGLPVYALDVVRAPSWVPGTSLAVLTLCASTLTTTALAATRTWARTTAISVGACCVIAWAGAAMGALWVPHAWVGPWLLASTLLLAAGSLLSGTRANALAEAAAPPAARGRYLAAFQYAFTAAVLLAPLLVSAFAVARWLPWLLVATTTAIGALALPLLARHLPHAAVRPTTPSQRALRSST